MYKSDNLKAKGGANARAVALRTIAPPLTVPESRLQPRSIEGTRPALWGANAQVTLFAASGLLFVSLANYAATHGQEWTDLLFWSGLILLFVPIALRLASSSPSRAERIVLLMELGLGMYLVKVIHSPVAFTFPDEFIHLRNLQEILTTFHLFGANSILPATPFYPGLEIVTAALAGTSGTAPFTAGLVVIGAARLIGTLALFLLFEELSGSARAASIGALLYTANSNYLFWTAQFSYESLALPLAITFMFVLLLRVNKNLAGVRAYSLTFAALLILFAIIVTHHLTSYFLVVMLWALVILYRIRRLDDKNGLLRMALIATFATLGWLLAVATPTFSYLAPVLRDAFQGLYRFVSDPGSGRELFRSGIGNVAPVWERLVALGSVGAILLLLPLGLVQIYRNYLNKPFALVLAGAALAYPLLLPLRLTRTSWEIANRASEFVFIGLAFVLALALVEYVLPRLEERMECFRTRPTRLRRTGAPALLSAIALLLFLGGVLAGWQPNARLAAPFNVAVGNATIFPQGIAAANWMRTTLGEDHRIAADYGNARLLLTEGKQNSMYGTARGLQALLNARQVDSGVREILQTNRLEYVMVDRRLSGQDPLIGIYFPPKSDGEAARPPYLDAAVYEKFDREPQFDRLFDSGDIFIYRVEAPNANSQTR